ncbi:MAG: outer membrane lipoprotein carrier protein LolA [Myxococcales bacterium FL481]|nr:MAG: outer membrane lipoprotein carrier protein LolA [Myxococcales bacterium FL481]
MSNLVASVFALSLVSTPAVVPSWSTYWSSLAESAQSWSAYFAPAAAAKRPAYRPKASEVLLMVQAFYDATTDLQANFTQTYYNSTFRTETVTGGQLKLKKPGMMLWDYAGQAEHDFYADGKKLWIVEHDTRQVTTSSMDENPDLNAAMQFLFGGDRLVREFLVRYAKDDRIQKYGDADHHVLELKPKKKQSRYKGLVLVVHATTGRVDGFTVYNHDGSTNYFRLDGVATNRGLDAKTFKFEVPNGYVKSTVAAEG